MGTSNLVGALKRKYGKTLWLEKRGLASQYDLGSLAHIIRMFEPNADVASIAPSRTYKADVRRSRRGRWYLTALDILRASGEPLTAHQIGQRVAFMTHRTGPGFAIEIAKSLYSTLERFDCVVRLEGRPRRWTIAAP